jgi:hypothetical protein
MARRAQLAPLLAGVALWLGLGAGACNTESGKAHGEFAVSSLVSCARTPAPDGGALPNLGLLGYACSGSARPDEDPGYDQGVPQGIVCADRGALADGSQGYCCSDAITPCALNPAAVCDAPSYGYQCLGSQRPESFDAELHCGQGVYQGDSNLINY